MNRKSSPVRKTLRSLLFCAPIWIAAPQSQAQTFSVVQSFVGGTGGENPVNGFIADGSGNFYGTASTGGANGKGVVFEIDAAGAETILHSFAGGVADGATPQGLLVRDSAGHLYGTTSAGGAHNLGTVYEITAAGEKILYSFAPHPDGNAPQAGLARDKAGNLYGTTFGGGPQGRGTVFELTRPAHATDPWIETVLYAFKGKTDGNKPVGGVALDAHGNLYGATSLGGDYNFGIVYELSPGSAGASTWTETILHEFQDGDDGAVPYATLIPDGAGNFYGTATEGGNNGGGTVFELSPSASGWAFNPVYSVPGWGISGTFRSVVLDGEGNIYGTTHCDGDYNAGTVYELSPSSAGWNYNLLYTFTGDSDGKYSFSNLVLRKGQLFGTTKYGGSNGKGVIFAVTP